MLRLVSILLVAILVVPLASAEPVNLYSARKEALIKPLLDRYEKQSGVEINLVTGSADALIKRLELEGRNSPADLLLTVDVGRLHRAKEVGVLQSVNSALLKEVISPQYRDPEGYWYGLSLRSRVIVYAPDRVAEDELSTYGALADEKWSGRICIRSSSNIYNQSLVASMIANEGMTETQAWAEGLVDNLARSPAGGDRDQIRAVAAGQCDVAVVNHYYLAGMLTSDRDEEREIANQVALFWPNQEGRGVHVNISGAGVTRSAGNPEGAIKLLEFLVSKEAQRWYAEVNNEYPVRDDVENSELQQTWGDFKADDVPLEKLGVHNADAVKLMDRAGWR